MFITSINIEYISTSANNQSLIERIGGTHPNGIAWRLRYEKAIEAIEKGQWNFHLTSNGTEKKVIVAKSKGNKYLKAISDDEDENSLLKLPDCPPIL